MPFTEEERSVLLKDLEPSRGAPAGFALHVGTDPNRAAQNQALARSSGMPLALVEAHPEEARRQSYLSREDVQSLFPDRPKLAQFLTDPDKAAIAWDDIEPLGALEDKYVDYSSRRNYFDNALRGMVNTATNLSMNVASYLSQTATHANRLFLTQPIDTITREVFGGEGTLTEGNQLAAEASARFFRKGMEASDYLADYDNRADIDKVFADPSAGNIAEFIAEAVPASLPYLAASIANPGLVFSAVGDSVTRERAKNDGRPDQLSAKDYTIGSATALPVAYLDRIMALKLLRSGAKVAGPASVGSFLGYTAKEIPKAIGREGFTEAFQGGVEYLGGTVGTEKGWNWDDLAKAAAAEGLAGAGVGGGIRAFTVRPEYNTMVAREAARDFHTRERSNAEQQYLDQHLFFAQESALAGRSSQDYADYLKTLDPDTEVFLSAEVAAELEGAPDYVVESLDGTGADIRIPLHQYIKDFVVDKPEWGTFTRPHIKLSENTKTQAEIEAAEPSAYIQNLIKKATAEQGVVTAIDQAYEDIKDALVDTRRQSETTARQSAELVKAYWATKYAELRKMDPALTIDKFLEDVKLQVVGPEGLRQETAPTFLNQERMDRLSTEEGMRAALDRVGETDFQRYVDLHFSEIDQTTLDEQQIDDEIRQVAQRVNDGAFGPQPTLQQNFGDIQLTDSGTDAAGNPINLTEPAQARWDDAQSRLDMVEQLRRCANG